MRRLTVAAALLLLPLLLHTPSVASQPLPQQRAAPVELRETYFSAVERQDAIAEGLALIQSLESTGGADPVDPALLAAYEGALITLRAKHGRWPPARLNHLRNGLSLLDAAVDARPEHVEIRYLRLMSCYYLPGILGRGRSVQEDFSALSRLLPAAADAYPPDLYRTMVAFVLENGRLDDQRAAALRRVLTEPHDG